MDKQREIELARSIHGDDKSDEEILELIDRANGISEGDRSKILMNALETEEGRKGLKHVAEHAMPREYADVFSKMIDGDEDDIVLSASSSVEEVEVSLVGDQLTILPTLNYFGYADITVYASDGLATGEESFELVVHSVNDLPEVQDVTITPAIPEDADDLILSYNYLDVDDEESFPIIVWFRDDVAQIEFADLLTVPGDTTQCDEFWYAIVTPNDGESDGNTVQSNTVEICGGNDPPVWTEDFPDQHIDEDSGDNVISMDGLITDPQQSLSQITFNTEYNSDPVHLNAEFDGSDLILTTLVENYFSPDPIILTLTADDGEDQGYDTTNVNVFINSVNDAPIFTSAGDTTATEDSMYSYSIISSDVDEGDELVITASTIPGWFQLVDNGDGTGTLEGIPENSDVDDHAVVLRVTDGSGAYAIQSFTITVANTNDAPVFTSEADTTAVEDEVYSYLVTANDVDGGDALELSAPTLPSWLDFSDNGDGTGILSGTPLNDQVGDHEVEL